MCHMGEQALCIRCGGTLDFVGAKSFREADVSIGPLKVGINPLWAPRFDVEVYVCRDCRHLELFAPDSQEPQP